MSVKVLVVDDSAVFRRVLAEALSSLPEVKVVGTASSGRMVLPRVRELRPDLLTLDMEMPEMDGLSVLDALRQARENVPVIVVSALTRQGGHLTLRALDKGAFDFITKPDCGSPSLNREAIRRELALRVRAIADRLGVRNILRSKGGPLSSVKTASLAKTADSERLAGLASRMQRLGAKMKPEMILIGVSTGGPAALARLLPSIPADIGVPLLVVQHMPPIFTQSLAESLAAKCAIRVREAVHGELAEPGTALIAPGGRQMRIVPGVNGSKIVQITDDPPEHNCRPAVDYLFRSAANHFPGRSTAVIMTGMGSDGTLGLRLLKHHGCYAIAQDAASCVVYGMPKAAVDAGVADAILPLDGIAARVIAVVRGSHL